MQESDTVVRKMEHDSTCSNLLQSEKLLRFFTKLVHEALHLKADGIVIKHEKENLNVTVLQGRSELKSLAIKTSWFPLILDWLFEREHFIESGSKPLKVSDIKNPSLEFSAAVRVSTQIVSFAVQKSVNLGGKGILNLSKFCLYQPAEFLERLFLFEEAKRCLDQVYANANGIIIAAGPDPENERRSVAVILSLCGGLYAGNLSQYKEQELLELSKRLPIVLSTQADDSFSLLQKVKSLGVLDIQGVLALIVQGFALQVCAKCARASVVDQTIVNSLPVALRPSVGVNYKVGLGCAACNQTGFNGYVGIQSGVVIEPGILDLIRNDMKPESLARALFARGIKPLLCDGVRKAFEGRVTFEELGRITRTIPVCYSEILSGKDVDCGEKIEALDISGNFFESSTPTNQPLRGRAAFGGRVIDDDVPLFAEAGLKKKRERPLLLVVEDDPDQRQILEMVFKAQEYDVIGAHDGKQGLEKISKELPDLVVTDLNMPIMDGQEMISRVRASPLYRHIPILVLTVVSDGEREYTLLDKGADDYCEKTIQRKILIKRVERLLKRSEMS